MFRGVQIQCAEEEKYSVLRSKNRVCREIEIQYAEEELERLVSDIWGLLSGRCPCW